MFKTIVVAVDGSQCGQKALKTAIGLQKITQSELLILTVFHTHSMWKASMTLVHPELTESTDSALEVYAKEVAENSKEYAFEQGVKNVRSFYIGGGPAREIIKFSEKYDAGLIILGSRGFGNSEINLLGSVSHKVTSLAQCPVMVV